jgi:hypothetical protein
MPVMFIFPKPRHDLRARGKIGDLLGMPRQAASDPEGRHIIGSRCFPTGPKGRLETCAIAA